MAEAPRHRVGILLFPEVTLLDVAGPSEVLHEANRYGAPYEVATYSLDGGPVRSSSGVILSADAAVAEAHDLDTALIPGADVRAGQPSRPGSRARTASIVSASAASLSGR